jgi:hypothetical protein
MLNSDEQKQPNISEDREGRAAEKQSFPREKPDDKKTKREQNTGEEGVEEA